jgi:phosphate transport system substrate-binding protein
VGHPESIIVRIYHWLGATHYLINLLAFVGGAAPVVLVALLGLQPPTYWWIGLLTALISIIVMLRSRVKKWLVSPFLRNTATICVVGIVIALLIMLIPKSYTLRVHRSQAIGTACARDLALAYLRQRKDVTSVDAPRDFGGGGVVLRGMLWNRSALNIEIQPTGTWEGLGDLASDDCDIAMASLRIPADERSVAGTDRDDARKAATIRALGNLRSPETEFVLGQDAVVVISGPAAALRTVERHRLHDIFLGNDDNFSVLIPGEKSEARRAFVDFVFGSGDDVGDKHNEDPFRRLGFPSFDTAEELHNQLLRKRNGIGVASWHDARHLPEASRALVGIEAAGRQPMVPTESSIRLEEYPFTQRLYLYTTPQRAVRTEVKDFVDFCLSESGQSLVGHTGLVAAEAGWQDVRKVPDAPRDYIDLAQNARRFSLSFRFGDDRRMEGKAERDLRRFKDFKGTPNGRTSDPILVVGFAGSPTSETVGRAHSCQASIEAANAVASWLQEHGVPPQKVLGFGDLLPISTGREGGSVDTRVEIWSASTVPKAADTLTCLQG